MPVVVVACPGCHSTLKAPDHMAGKKAKCKKCGTSFHVPGASSTDTSSESQLLSTVDLPQPTLPAAPSGNPFDFGALQDAPTPSRDTPPPMKPTAQVAAKPSASTANPGTKSLAKTNSKPAINKSTAPPADATDVVQDLAPSEEPLMDFTRPAKDAEPTPTPPCKTKSTPAKKPLPTPIPTDGFEFAPAGAQDDQESQEGDLAVDPSPGLRRHGGQRAGGRGAGKLVIVATVFGLVMVGGVAGVLLYLNQKKEPELAKVEKRDEKKSPDTPAPAAKGSDAPTADASGAKDNASEGTSTKERGKGSPARNSPSLRLAGKAKATSLLTPSLALADGKPIQFDPLSAKPQAVQNRNVLIVIDEVKLPSVRGVFPPLRKDVDPAVLWEAKSGFQGQGEKLNLDLYSSQSLKRVGRVEVDGDGSAEPICDLSVSADLYAHAANGKVTVYNTRDKSRLVEAFDPYADKPEQKKVGLAAVYLTEPPDRMMTVSKAGAVHVWSIPAMKQVGEYIPPKATVERIVVGKNVAPGPGRTSVVVAVGGVVYRVSAEPGAAGTVISDLGGGVGRSLGLAWGAGRLLYVFETDADAKKEKAVMVLNGDGKSVFFRWPEKVGDPVSVGWAGDNLAVIGTGIGSAVWFEVSEGTIQPLALIKTPPADRVRHATSDDYWVLLPDPTNPARSMLVEYTMPPQGLYDPLTTTKRPSLTLQVDEKAISK